jgi:hypothetical protein
MFKSILQNHTGSKTNFGQQHPTQENRTPCGTLVFFEQLQINEDKHHPKPGRDYNTKI